MPGRYLVGQHGCRPNAGIEEERLAVGIPEQPRGAVCLTCSCIPTEAFTNLPDSVWPASRCASLGAGLHRKARDGIGSPCCGLGNTPRRCVADAVPTSAWMRLGCGRTMSECVWLVPFSLPARAGGEAGEPGRKGKTRRSEASRLRHCRAEVAVGCPPSEVLLRGGVVRSRKASSL
jgi:hypothetical protein